MAVELEDIDATDDWAVETMIAVVQREVAAMPS
ncbi:hypothetical protein OJF2_05850 [Aquisphaera giovannonii]|uniref:Uncharacterized protein n=1 Tax=Aquisphaera giovannonii TaxID=406548 RepID=A0A5B9VUE6_9BACT|nr:hypothetical protein OJF2_05850 [Aquisphaera giovannonii]